MSYTSIGSFNSGLWKGGVSKTVSVINLKNSFNEAYFYWNPVSDISGYTISLTGNISGVVLGNTTFTTSNTFQFFSGLKDNSPYNFSITTTKGTKTFGPTILSFTTLKLPYSSTVASVKSTNLIDTTWTFTNGITDYTVYNDISLAFILVGKGGDFRGINGNTTVSDPYNLSNNVCLYVYGSTGGEVKYLLPRSISNAYSVYYGFDPSYSNPYTFSIKTAGTIDSNNTYITETNIVGNAIPISANPLLDNYATNLELTLNSGNNPTIDASYITPGTNRRYNYIDTDGTANPVYADYSSGGGYPNNSNNLVLLNDVSYNIVGGGGAGVSGSGINGTISSGGSGGAGTMISVNNVVYGPYGGGGGGSLVSVNKTTGSWTTVSSTGSGGGGAGGTVNGNGTPNTGGGAGASYVSTYAGNAITFNHNKGGSGVVVIIGTISLLPSPVSGLSCGNIVANSTTNTYSIDISYNQSVNNVIGYCISFTGNVIDASGVVGNTFIINSPTKLINKFTGFNGGVTNTISAYSIGMYGNSISNSIVKSVSVYPPTGLTGNKLLTTSTSINISYTAPSVITVKYYSLTAVDISNASIVINKSNISPDTSYNLTDLSSGNVYSISMKTINDFGTSASSTILTYGTNPNPPTITSNTNTSTSITVSFSKPTGLFSSYYVYCVDISNSASFSTSLDISSVATYTIPSLISGNVYNISMYSSSIYGNSINSTVLKYGTKPNPPTITSNTNTSTSITVNFSKPTGLFSSYYVYCVDISNSSSFSTSLDISSVTTYTIPSLISGNVYNISMYSSSIYGNSVSSTILKYGTTPNPPINLLFTTNTGNSISFSFTKPSGSITIYYVNANTIDGSFSAPANSYKVSGLVPNTLYSITLKSSNNYGNSIASNTLTASTGGDASGGNITINGLYTVHTFIHSDTFIIYGGINYVNVFIVSGGSTGGLDSQSLGQSFGGGGGGVTDVSRVPITNGSYSVSVGGSDSPSQFRDLSACAKVGYDGYSGNVTKGVYGNLSSSNLYHPGSGFNFSGSYGDGGAGTGGNGNSFTTTTAGNGGAGYLFSLNSTIYAGGGGGGTSSSLGVTGGSGGSGGGGRGGNSGNANTGGGGGGSLYNVGEGKGGTGIVIIYYTT